MVISATYRANADGGVAEVEELINAGEDHGPANTKEPRADRVDGHGGIIKVRDRRADLGVWRVILCVQQVG